MLDEDESDTIEMDIPEVDPSNEIYATIFGELDRDYSGGLDPDEFKRFMAQSKHEKHAEVIFKVLDKNRDGVVSLEEFLAFGRATWAMRTKGDVRGYARLLFDACDEENKGSLDKEQFLTFMKLTGNKVRLWNRSRQFKKWDTDKSGSIDFAEIMAKFKFKMAKPLQ